MERRFRVRLDELRSDAEVPPCGLGGVLPRLESFLTLFVESLKSTEQRTNAKHDVAGLVSDLGSKNAESIADLHDRERQGLPTFLSQAEWGHGPLLAELAKQIGGELGQPDGILVFDPSPFPKKGTESVGLGRPWCGRLGKLDNCQVGIDLGSARLMQFQVAGVMAASRKSRKSGLSFWTSAPIAACGNTPSTPNQRRTEARASEKVTPTFPGQSATRTRYDSGTRVKRAATTEYRPNRQGAARRSVFLHQPRVVSRPRAERHS